MAKQKKTTQTTVIDNKDKSTPITEVVNTQPIAKKLTNVDTPLVKEVTEVVDNNKDKSTPITEVVDNNKDKSTPITEVVDNGKMKENNVLEQEAISKFLSISGL